MSALIFQLAPKQVIVTMDTLVTDPKGIPIGYTSKIYPLTHLGGVMCVTGLSNLAQDWLLKLHCVVARDMKCLDDFAMQSLRKMWQRYSVGSSRRATVYHFGYSVEEQQYVGFSYRSTNNFKSERLECAIGFKPPLPDFAIKSTKDFVTAMCRQREQEQGKTAGSRLYIGGEIQMAVLKNQAISLKTLYRFPDYGGMYDQIL